MTISKDINIFLKWIEICQKHGRDVMSDYTSLRINSHKSALLERMLSGLDPLPNPPPLSFSYPWYTLIEDGIDYPLEVFKPSAQFTEYFKHPMLVINQSFWRIVKEIGPDEWEVTYTYNESDKKVTAPDTWIVKCVGIRNEGGDSPFDKFWEIKIVTSPVMP